MRFGSAGAVRVCVKVGRRLPGSRGTIGGGINFLASKALRVSISFSSRRRRRRAWRVRSSSSESLDSELELVSEAGPKLRGSLGKEPGMSDLRLAEITGWLDCARSVDGVNESWLDMVGTPCRAEYA